MAALRRRNRRRRWRTSRPNGGSGMRFYSPEQFQQKKLYNPDMYHPSVQMPAVMLPWLQQHIRSNAAYPAASDRLDALAGTHFGDGKTAWPHLQTAFGLFKFRLRDKSDRLNLVNSILLGVMFTLVTVFGREGGFRYWCALWESAFSGTRVEFPEGSEPVALLRFVDEDDAPGWDQYFPDYDLYTQHELESSIDEAKATRHWQQSAHLPSTQYPKIAMRTFLRLAHEHGDEAADEQAYGDIHSSLAYGIARANAQPLLALDDDVFTMSAERNALAERSLFGPSATVDLDAVKAYGSTVAKSYSQALGRAPHYPLKGYDFDQLSRLVPIQRYGFDRGDYIHRGLDLPAPTGTPVLAMYPGVVVKFQAGIGEGSPEDGPRGNYVQIFTPFDESDAGLLHEYYHLDSIEEFKVGQGVRAGEQIGTIGNTGNSKGPHLHLSTRLSRWNPRARRAYQRVTIDPEMVLRSSAVQAARESGHSFGDPNKPHLGVPLYILSTVSGAGYSSSTPLHIVQANTEAYQAYENGQGDPGTPPPSDPPPTGAPQGEGQTTTGQKFKKLLVRIAPDAVGVSLQTALVAAGIDPVVAGAAGQTVSEVIRSRQVAASGDPDVDTVIAQTRAKAREILGGKTLEEAGGDFLPYLENHLRTNWDSYSA